MNRIIYTGYGYEAAIAGFNAANGPFLSVTRKADNDTGTRGRYVQGQEALEWAEAIETAIDSKEAAVLCKAIYGG